MKTKRSEQSIKKYHYYSQDREGFLEDESKEGSQINQEERIRKEIQNQAERGVLI